MINLFIETENGNIAEIFLTSRWFSRLHANQVMVRMQWLQFDRCVGIKSVFINWDSKFNGKCLE